MPHQQVASDANEFQRVAKAASEIEEMVDFYRKHMSLEKQLVESQAYLKEVQVHHIHLSHQLDHSIYHPYLSVSVLEPAFAALKPIHHLPQIWRGIASKDRGNKGNNMDFSVGLSLALGANGFSVCSTPRISIMLRPVHPSIYISISLCLYFNALP